MSKHLEYKGYIGSIEPNLDQNYLYGKILFINDLVTYTADNLVDLREEFVKSVDEYLTVCAELGDEPDQPFKGSFNIRVGPDLHRRAALDAAKTGITLNDYVKGAISMRLDLNSDHNNVIRHEHTHVITVRTQEKEFSSSYSSNEDVAWKAQPSNMRLVK